MQLETMVSVDFLRFNFLGMLENIKIINGLRLSGERRRKKLKRLSHLYLPVTRIIIIILIIL